MEELRTKSTMRYRLPTRSLASNRAHTCQSARHAPSQSCPSLVNPVPRFSCTWPITYSKGICRLSRCNAPLEQIGILSCIDSDRDSYAPPLKSAFDVDAREAFSIQSAVDADLTTTSSLPPTRRTVPPNRRSRNAGPIQGNRESCAIGKSPRSECTHFAS